MPKFYFYEEICSLVEGDDYDDAFEKYSYFTDEERAAAYMNSHVEVKELKEE
jgi:hypothetical protein